MPFFTPIEIKILEIICCGVGVGSCILLYVHDVLVVKSFWPPWLMIFCVL
jgi:hypothetical protein